MKSNRLNTYYASSRRQYTSIRRSAPIMSLFSAVGDLGINIDSVVSVRTMHVAK